MGTTAELLQAGKLDQTCPVECRKGWRRTDPGSEAAGHHCSACGVPTGAEHWYRPQASEAQIAVLTHARALRASQLEETAVAVG